jgi:hypothetical protein
MVSWLTVVGSIGGSGQGAFHSPAGGKSKEDEQTPSRRPGNTGEMAIKFQDKQNNLLVVSLSCLYSASLSPQLEDARLGLALSDPGEMP